MSNSGWPVAVAISVFFVCYVKVSTSEAQVKIAQAEARVKVAQAEATSKQQAILAGCSK